jgi:hypothetical protein
LLVEVQVDVAGLQRLDRAQQSCRTCWPITKSSRTNDSEANARRERLPPTR